MRRLRSGLEVLKEGKAERVVFFYSGEEGTYIENASVRLYENGIVFIESQGETTTTDIRNCEILWAKEGEGRLKLLRPEPKTIDHPQP